MKLIILRSNLKEVLSAVERVVTDNPTLPVLKHVLLKADTRLIIQATNLEIGVTAATGAKITEQGSISVPFAPLYSIISNSTSDRVALETHDNTISISTDNYHAKIQGSPAEEFPIIPKLEDESRSIELTTDVFQGALQQIVSAAASNDFKPELNSVLLSAGPSSLKLVATDGFRLAEKTLPNNTYGTTIHADTQVLIPLKTVQEALRIFPKGEQLTIALDNSQILLRAKETTLISRLIDGNYPDYSAIVPKQLTTELSLERDQFASAIKLVSNFSGRTSDITLKLAEDAKAVEIFAANQLVGENSYQVPIKKKKVEGISKVVFNWRYLLDAVKSMPDPVITLGFTSENRPVIVRASGDDSIFYIVMPIQI
jgi:DNA polymerase III subunit beta